ncbi:hypothetical protein LEP1GSC193_2748 [Leptospira alstonii serovar Pingchang str. 80-412]|uniref:Uncharacterized protein n=3 Tax=Leptospira alstonii TaxID=28452 RepID=M6CUE6_9LEPT|nr:hypothetical protein LEP1GSC194_0111 [Leptospira alstonii serovar Sichuan str. 79601]EQA79286.1 hypothetical protein LEP1GSC193_2748 [Leptospira alstonii serovar Pingchang str. 80-412]
MDIPSISAYVFLFTLVKVALELIHSSKSSFSSLLNFSSILYLVVSSIVNMLASILCFPILKDKMSNDLKSSFAYAFLATFASEAFVRNLNMSFFDIGILSIRDWLNKVKELAIGATLFKAEADSTHSRHKKVDELLKKVSDEQLDFHINRLFTENVLASDILTDAGNSNDPISYKAWAIVSNFPLEADALIKNNKYRPNIANVIN